MYDYNNTTIWFQPFVTKLYVGLYTFSYSFSDDFLPAWLIWLIFFSFASIYLTQ